MDSCRTLQEGVRSGAYDGVLAALYGLDGSRASLEQARERAIVEAAHGFNWCPLCGRLVCNRCFLICDDLDMCRTCAEDLHERGDPVA